MKKLHYVILVLLVLIVGTQLLLPRLLKNYVVNRINKIPEYEVQIDSINIHLLQGKYSINELELFKVSKNIPIPFVSAKKIDFAVEWGALFHGRLAAKISAFNPKLNFVMDPQGNEEQLTINDEWQNAVKALFPLNFNSIYLYNGAITLQSFKGKPPFKLTLNDINFNIKNMQQVQTKGKKLFSSFNGTAMINQGRFKINGHVNPFKDEPMFLLKSSLVNMQIEQSNDFLQHFTHIKVNGGNFAVFTEIAAANGKITGYAKPIVKNLKIFSSKEKLNPIEFLYKGIVVLGSKIVTNQDKKTIATKINIKGDIDAPNTNILSIIGYSLSHAFIQALLPQIDNTIQMQDVTINNPLKWGPRSE